MLIFVPEGWVYGDATVVFAFDDDYHFALLQSNVHEVWLRKQASSLRTDVRYTPTDCFDTFPFPLPEYEVGGDLEKLPKIPTFVEAARIGAEYHEHRRQIMLTRRIGLTRTYNLFHDPNCTDDDIVRLRELHTQMDKAILACYGWTDIDPQHDFYRNERGQTRFTVSPQSRREILHRLYKLNEFVAAIETVIENFHRPFAQKMIHYDTKIPLGDKFQLAIQWKGEGFPRWQLIPKDRESEKKREGEAPV